MHSKGNEKTGLWKCPISCYSRLSLLSPESHLPCFGPRPVVPSGQWDPKRELSNRLESYLENWPRPLQESDQSPE